MGLNHGTECLDFWERNKSNLIPHSKVHLIIESCKNSPTLSELYENNCKTSSVKNKHIYCLICLFHIYWMKFRSLSTAPWHFHSISRCLFCNSFRRARSITAHFYTIQLSNEPWNGELNLTCFFPRNLNNQRFIW